MYVCMYVWVNVCMYLCVNLFQKAEALEAHLGAHTRKTRVMHYFDIRLFLWNNKYTWSHIIYYINAYIHTYIHTVPMASCMISMMRLFQDWRWMCVVLLIALIAERILSDDCFWLQMMQIMNTLCMRACMYVCMYVCMCVCVCVCICIYVCMYSSSNVSACMNSYVFLNAVYVIYISVWISAR